MIVLLLMQTNFFKEILRDEIISRINSVINGRLNIERIDGTIITSVYLYNTSIVDEKDTLFFAEKIEINYDPFALLLKVISINEILLSNAKINLMQNQNGEWNFEQIFGKPSKELEIEEGVDSLFGYEMEFNKLKIENTSILRQTYDNLHSRQKYDYFNLSDLKVDNLNLETMVLADIDEKDFEIVLKNFSFNSNINNFNLKELYGKFEITKDKVKLDNFFLETTNSKLSLDATASNFNLFGNLNEKMLQKSIVNLDLKVDSIDFYELAIFVPDLKMFDGRANLYLNAEGKFDNVQLKTLFVNYGDTKFNITGAIKNLHNTDTLFIDVNVNNSKANYADVNRFMPTLELPRYKNLILSDMQMNYTGAPGNFISVGSFKLNNGEIKFTSDLDFTKEIPNYNAQVETKNIDLRSILEIPTNLNMKASIIGSGLEPNELNNDIRLNAFNSKANYQSIDTLNLISSSKSGLIIFDLFAAINNSSTKLDGRINLNDNKHLSYKIKGNTNNLNLEKFLKNPDFNSNLNLKYFAEGKNVSLDSITGDFSVYSNNSSFNNRKFDSTYLILSLDNDKKEKRINLLSNILDFNIEGIFNTSDALAVISTQVEVISRIIKNKSLELNPLYKKSDTEIKFNELEISNILNKEVKLDYDFEIKNLDIFEPILDYDYIDAIVIGEGNITNDTSDFSVTLDINIKNFSAIKENDLLYAENLLLNINFNRDNKKYLFDNLFGNLSITSDHVFVGSSFQDISCDLVFNQNKMFFNIVTTFDSTIKTETEGNLIMEGYEQHLILDKLILDYNELAFTNLDPLMLSISPNYIKLKNFMLVKDMASLRIDGIINDDGRQDILLTLINFKKDIINKLLFNSENTVDANLNLTAKLFGTIDKPIINVDLDVYDVSYMEKVFGSLLCTFYYEDEIIQSKIFFVDSTYNKNDPMLVIDGTIPVNLSYTFTGDRTPDDEEIAITIFSDNFNLRALSGLIPEVKNPEGDLIADIKISGSLSEPNYLGMLKIVNGYAELLPTNLSYDFNSTINFIGNTIDIENFQIANNTGSKNKGLLSVQGYIEMDGFSLNKINLELNGNIALLGKESKTVSPNLYGELFIASEGSWKFSYLDNFSQFKGTIVLKDVDVYFASEKITGSSGDEFVYKYYADTSDSQRKSRKFDELISLTSVEEEIVEETIQKFELSYDIIVKTESNARLEFALDKTLNQKLIAIVDGTTRFINREGFQFTQGQFDLQEGSYLIFIKKLDAIGMIRFESDIADPYLNITASYPFTYLPSGSSSYPEDYAVKIKLKGLFSQLGANFVRSTDNIAVYTGRQDIENDIPNTTYDEADALSFILIGAPMRGGQSTGGDVSNEFLKDFSNSFFGTVLTNAANEVFGDAISEIQVGEKDYGFETRYSVSISGRYKNIKYTLGGTEDIFQNLSDATVRIEWLFSKNFALRIERRDPVSNTMKFGEKIDELGLKYRFEF
ncbi:MAG: hypothetical protein JXA68_06345 [Ignavibacteriales bacterium]|nr:hypothetical protein [Ignavibacteriales bacterium]